MAKLQAKTGTVTRESRGSVSLVDVASHAQVSLATASRVINGHPSVASDLRRKVLLSSRTLGFSPRRITRCLAVVTGRHSPAMPTGYVGILTSLVARFAAARNVVVELIDVDHLDLCYGAHVDAVVGIVFDDRLTELLNVPKLPIVTINRPMADLGIHSLWADHYEQGFLATTHLIQRGHRDIGFLAIEPDEWGCRERLRGFTDALGRAGLTPDPSRVQNTTESPVYDILARWKSRGVTAILNFSEDTGLEVLHILSNVLGLQIGRDISTISLEDIPVYQYMTPPQTVVRQPLELLARRAVERALELADNPDDSTITKECMATELIERDSVATVRSEPV